MSPIANSSDEFWSINGVSLHQHGWSVTTVGGSRYDLPPRRGENLHIAYVPGAQHRAKIADSRTVSLIMWMTGSNPATGAAAADQRLQWNDNWEFLRRLVWKPAGDQVTLTRRWFRTVGGTPTLVVADALAEMAGSMSPTMTGRTRADFTLDFLLADPFFYEAQITTNLSLDTPATVTNNGTDVAAHNNVSIDFVGPLTNPKLTNFSAAPDVWLAYDGTIANGVTVRFDVTQFLATQLPSTNVIANVRNSGARHWFGVLPGSNTVELTADSGSGSAVLRFRPPHV